MKRRTYLGAGGLGALSALAGCLDAIGASGGDGTGSSDGPRASDDAVLGPPEQDLSASVHPTYGDEIPSYSVPDAVSGETVSDTDFHGERAQLYTFYYTNCPDGVCPALLQRLVTVNLSVRDEGYADDAAFVPITFDPNRDTAEVIESHAADFGVDPTADDWYFLRPETQDAAYDLVMAEDGGFGLPIEEQEPGEHDHDGTGDADNESDHGHGEYTFTHYALILLVNDQGIVERSYPNATRVQPSRIEEDMLAVLEG